MPDASALRTTHVGILTMEATLLDEQSLADFEHWLNVECRCFGDKGDVEDITEGQYAVS